MRDMSNMIKSFIAKSTIVSFVLGDTLRSLALGRYDNQALFKHNIVMKSHKH